MDPIHVVGAGGIGCAVGYALLQAQVPVVFVETSRDKIAAGERDGVRLRQGARAPRSPRPATFTRFADWSPPPNALVLLCTKCPANADVLARLPPGTYLIPIQNGVDPALVARGPHVEGVASFVSECRRDAPFTRITRAGSLHLGVHGTPTPNLRQLAGKLANALRSGPFRVRLVEDIRPFKYTKLLYNAAISPLAASAGLDNGELLRWKPLRRLFFALLRENHAILQHAGLPLDKVGPLHPATVARILARPWLANALAPVFYPSLRGTYCSMAHDLPHGPTEIDNYNGHLLTLAGDFPCPLNRAVYALVKRIEAETLTPRPELLDELFPAGG